jgi:hypothetical protein
VITLGIDPSLTGLGWCVHDGDVVGPGRVIAKGWFSTPREQIDYLRYMFLREAVGRVLAAYPQIEGVGVESPPFGESWSEGLYGLFLYMNEALVRARKDVVYFDPLRVKLLTKMDSSIRRGKMDKSDMIDAAKAETSIRVWNHNEADAYIIARSAARFWDFQRKLVTVDELTPSERSIFPKVVEKKNDRYYLFSSLTDADLVIDPVVIAGKSTMPKPVREPRAPRAELKRT